MLPLRTPFIELFPYIGILIGLIPLSISRTAVTLFRFCPEGMQLELSWMLPLGSYILFEIRAWSIWHLQNSFPARLA